MLFRSQVCCIAGFQTRRPRDIVRPADLEVGDAAGLETCVTTKRSLVEQFAKEKRVDTRSIVPMQGNILHLPFASETFDLIITCGVMEYVPLDDGFKELARVIKPGGKLVFIPVKESLVGTVLEFLYNFKIHPVKNVRKISQRYFSIVGKHRFPRSEPIGWSKSIFLLEKKEPLTE